MLKIIACIAIALLLWESNFWYLVITGLIAWTFL